MSLVLFKGLRLCNAVINNELSLLRRVPVLGTLRNCGCRTIPERCASSIGLKHMISIGDEAEVTKTFTDEDLEQFSQLSGDTNPIHLNEEYAKLGRFGKRVVHGSLTLSLVSGVIGTTLPGPGCILVAQEAEFIAPLYVGETVTCKLHITGMKKLILFAGFSCVTPNGKEVIKGKATMLYQPVRLSDDNPDEKKDS